MEIVKKPYGRLGKLHRKEWKRYLDSGSGLFRGARQPPGNVVGPRLDRFGRVVGDIMSMELAYFSKTATPEQQEFFEELLSVNPAAAKEYMLTISGSIERWKEDMKWLKVALHYLEKEGNILDIEKDIIKESELRNISMKLPPILQRHFPSIFADIGLESLQLEKIEERIKELDRRIRSRERYLKEYIMEKEKELPFLFE